MNHKVFHTKRETETKTETDRQTDRLTDGQTETDRQREKQGQTDRQIRQRQTDRDRQSQRARDRDTIWLVGHRRLLVSFYIMQKELCGRGERRGRLSEHADDPPVYYTTSSTGPLKSTRQLGLSTLSPGLRCLLRR